MAVVRSELFGTLLRRLAMHVLSEDFGAVFITSVEKAMVLMQQVSLPLVDHHMTSYAISVLGLARRVTVAGPSSLTRRAVGDVYLRWF